MSLSFCILFQGGVSVGAPPPGLLCAEITLAPHNTMLSSLRVFPSILGGYTLGSKSECQRESALTAWDRERHNAERLTLHFSSS